MATTTSTGTGGSRHRHGGQQEQQQQNRGGNDVDPSRGRDEEKETAMAATAPREQQQQQQQQSGGSPVLIRVDLAVDGMMCQKNCGTTVANALKSCFVDGGADAGGGGDGESAKISVVHAEAVFSERRAYALFSVAAGAGAAPSSSPDATAGSSNSNDYFRRKCVEEAIDAVECVGFDAEEIEDLQVHLDAEEEEQTRRKAAATRNGGSPLSRNDDDDDDRGGAYLPQKPQAAATVAPKEDRSSSSPSPSPPSSPRTTVVLEVTGMSCAICVGKVERALRDVPGAGRAAVVLSTGRAVVEPDEMMTVMSKGGIDGGSGSNIDLLAESCASAVRGMGYGCEVVRSQSMSLRDNARQIDDSRRAELLRWRRLVALSTVLTVPLVVLSRVHTHYPICSLSVQFALSTVVQFVVGYRFYRSAYNAWPGMGMDFLIAMGTTASYLYSVVVFALICAGGGTGLMATFATGPMLLTFVAVGKFLECYATGQTASALQALMELQPNQALRATRQGGREEEDLDSTQDLSSLATEQVQLSDVRVGDYLMVLPGARIPTDGKLVAMSNSKNISGNGATGGLDYTPSCSGGLEEMVVQAYVDESALSGEPFPVAKSLGEDVYGSTVNQLNVLLIKVTATGSSTVLAKIVRLMEEAQSKKAPIQKHADRIAGVFAPTVIAISTLTLLGWLIFNDQDKKLTAAERFFVAMMSSISVLVVACPCALGLATPTAVMVGTGVGARQGLLIKGGAALEHLHSVDAVVLDKTGTLTTGTAVLGKRVNFLPQDSGSDELFNEHIPARISREQLPLWLAACAEAQSEHPLAKAVVNAAKSAWGGDVTLSQEGVRVEAFSVVPGKGVECLVSKAGWGAWFVRVGSRDWTKGSGPGSDEDKTGDDEVTDLRHQGQIAVYVSVASEPNAARRRVIAVIGIVDPVAKEAASTVAALQRSGIEVYMCTGDHELTALAVAELVGIPAHNVCADVKPEGKADFISQLQGRDHEDIKSSQRQQELGRRSPRRVAVVGDGINDAIALARADVGIALGAGTQVAVEAADVVLVRSSLHDVVVAIHLSRVVFRRIIMNFVWAMSYNIFALPFAAGVLYPFIDFRLPPEFAGLMMAFSSVSVVTSSLLLRNYTRPKVLPDGTLEGGDGILSKLSNLTSVSPLRRRSEYSIVPTKQVDIELV